MGCRIVMGTVRSAPAIWERYVAAGGDAFDTARHYGDGSEGALGRFLERNELRHRVFLVGKGAHPPTCAPEHVAPQLERSLELLRTDHLDLYLLHRDNPSVEVEAWSDALEPHVESGRVRALGASNWTTARIAAFNDAAARRGRTPFSAVSNQLSLAGMNEPVWPAALRADVEWHERTQMPLYAWSAQARGFFSGRSDRAAEMKRCWLSPANLALRERAQEEGARLGVAPVTIALAWVLARPFPTHVLVGPRDAAELDACFAALSIGPPAIP